MQKQIITQGGIYFKRGKDSNLLLTVASAEQNATHPQKHLEMEGTNLSHCCRCRHRRRRRHHHNHHHHHHLSKMLQVRPCRLKLVVESHLETRGTIAPQELIKKTRRLHHFFGGGGGGATRLFPRCLEGVQRFICHRNEIDRGRRASRPSSENGLEILSFFFPSFLPFFFPR